MATEQESEQDQKLEMCTEDSGIVDQNGDDITQQGPNDYSSCSEEDSHLGLSNNETVSTQ